MRKRIVMTGLIAGTVLSAVSAEIESAASYVFARPERSSFWRTAASSVMTLPIEYPAGATSATLEVRGVSYARDIAGITAAEYALTLPAAADLPEENVYSLTLRFDNGSVQTASIAVVGGVGTTAGETRCLSPTNTVAWRNCGKRAVLPVPYGTTSLTVDGVDVAAGLDGAQGWYALGPIRGGATSRLALTDGEGAFVAEGFRPMPGFMLLFR